MKLQTSARPRPTLRILLAALPGLLALAQPARAGPDYKIVTASEKGTYYAIGQDLARIVAPGAGLQLEVLPSSGSAANVKLLRFEAGVKLGIVQADVFQAFVDRAGRGNAEAATLIKPLRVILPLYNTEIHYLVRADSPMNHLHDIKDARINGGLVGSGAALITHTLYRLMFDAPMPETQASFLSNEEALLKLIGDKSVDVVVVAAGQPAPLIANMKPEAQKFIKLLKFDTQHASAAAALRTYPAATMRASSYPNLLREDFSTVSVGAYLVSYDFARSDTQAHLARFGRSLCQNFARLQEEGHPKWREVQLSLPKLGPGWQYYGPSSRELRRCAAHKKAPPKASCSAEEVILGLCG